MKNEALFINQPSQPEENTFAEGLNGNINLSQLPPEKIPTTQESIADLHQTIAEMKQEIDDLKSEKEIKETKAVSIQDLKEWGSVNFPTFKKAFSMIGGGFKKAYEGLKYASGEGADKFREEKVKPAVKAAKESVKGAIESGAKNIQQRAEKIKQNREISGILNDSSYTEFIYSKEDASQKIKSKIEQLKDDNFKLEVDSLNIGDVELTEEVIESEEGMKLFKKLQKLNIKLSDNDIAETDKVRIRIEINQLDSQIRAAELADIDLGIKENEKKIRKIEKKLSKNKDKNKLANIEDAKNAARAALERLKEMDLDFAFYGSNEFKKSELGKFLEKYPSVISKEFEDRIDNELEEEVEFKEENNLEGFTKLQQGYRDLIDTEPGDIIDLDIDGEKFNIQVTENGFTYNEKEYKRFTTLFLGDNNSIISIDVKDGKVKALAQALGAAEEIHYKINKPEKKVDIQPVIKYDGFENDEKNKLQEIGMTRFDINLEEGDLVVGDDTGTLQITKNGKLISNDDLSLGKIEPINSVSGDLYKFSYPGYDDILIGVEDMKPISLRKINNNSAYRSFSYRVEDNK